MKYRIFRFFVTKNNYSYSIDKDGDNIYVVDSGELESAIFKEGILKFDVMFFKHEIIYTVQYVNAQNPDEPNQVTFLFFSKKKINLSIVKFPPYIWLGVYNRFSG